MALPAKYAWGGTESESTEIRPPGWAAPSTVLAMATR